MKKTILAAAAALMLAAPAQADWGSKANPLEIFPLDTTIFGYTDAAGKDIVWYCIYESSTDKDTPEELREAIYTFKLQGVKTNGELVFPEGGLSVCNYTNLSYTLYNNFVFVDNDDNAIVLAVDLRNSDLDERMQSLHAYKISPEGKMLWGEDGISLDGEAKYKTPTAAQGCQLQDGSYVIAWQDGDTGTSYMQRVSEDGSKLLWGEKPINGAGFYPILIPAEDNQVILVSMANGGIVADKYDFDGEKAWPETVSVYPYGFNSMTPAYLLFDAKPVDGGGVLVYWYDDRNNIGYQSPYCSYVTSDGKLAFAGASDDGDCKMMTGSFYTALYLQAAPCPDGSGFVAMWANNYANMNNYGGVNAQKVSLDGEVLWAEEGIEIMETTTQTSYNPVTILSDDKNNIALFIEGSEMKDGLSGWNNMNYYLHLMDATDGKPVWEDNLVINDYACHLGYGTAFNFPEEKCWITTFRRGNYSTHDEVVLANRIGYDGKFFEGTGVETVTENTDNGIKIGFTGRKVSVTLDEAGTAEANILDLSGRTVKSVNGNFKSGANYIDIDELPAGAYIVAVKANGGTASFKLVK